MSTEGRLRESICRIGRSLFDRGYTHGASGNISVLLDDGGMLTTPTNVSLGMLTPDRLSRLDAGGGLVKGPPPTKEVPLHRALYGVRPAGRAVVHLHATHSVALSVLPGAGDGAVIQPLTAYYVMRVGRTVLLPYYRPGDPAVADAIRAQAGTYGAVLLANHGPIVAGRDLDDAAWAIEELEQTARIQLLLGDRPATCVPAAEIDQLLAMHHGA